MVGIPVHCENCPESGIVHNVIGGTDWRELTLSGITLARCRRCGGAMRPRAGSYDFVGGVLTAFRELESDQLREVRDVLRRAHADEIPDSEAAAEVERIAPQLAPVIAALTSQSAATWIQTMLAVVAVVLGWMTLRATEPTEADHEALRRQIQIAIRDSQKLDRAEGMHPLTREPPYAQKRPQGAERKRHKRPPKTYGKVKRRGKR